MHEKWLQKYIKEHYRQIGFNQLYGPFTYGADFKGIYAEKPVKVEAEWEYADYISHKHSTRFADILVVATLDPVPEHLKSRLPSTIINLNREQVMEWAQPRMVKQEKEDYYAYPWRRLSRNLLYLYSFFQNHNRQKPDFVGSDLVSTMYRNQKPPGFHFGPGGKEEGFAGSEEDKVAWDYWLTMAHAVGDHFGLKPTLLRPTWIDRIAIYCNHTGRITGSEKKRFQDVVTFIDVLLRGKGY